MELTESGAKLKKLKVCWSIEDQNTQIQNHELKWKRRPTLGLAFEFGKDVIELILKIKISIEDWIEQTTIEDWFGNCNFFGAFFF